MSEIRSIHDALMTNSLVEEARSNFDIAAESNGLDVAIEELDDLEDSIEEIIFDMVRKAENSMFSAEDMSVSVIVSEHDIDEPTTTTMEIEVALLSNTDGGWHSFVLKIDHNNKVLHDENFPPVRSEEEEVS